VGVARTALLRTIARLDNGVCDVLPIGSKGPSECPLVETRTEIIELTDTLRGNLEKVVQHGKRADAVVKNMLLHSRQGSGEHRAVDIDALVEESSPEPAVATSLNGAAPTTLAKSLDLN
jgi:hypothetical protein